VDNSSDVYYFRFILIVALVRSDRTESSPTLLLYSLFALKSAIINC